MCLTLLMADFMASSFPNDLTNGLGESQQAGQPWLAKHYDREVHHRVDRAGDVVRAGYQPRASGVHGVRLHQVEAMQRLAAYRADDLPVLTWADRMDIA